MFDNFPEDQNIREYLALRADKSQSAAVKNARKIRCFLKWVARFILPGFLVGKPNLWDNLQTLRRQPSFKPLRTAIVVWMIFAVVMGSSGLYALLTAPPAKAADAWMNVDWGYRKKITLNNTDANLGVASETLTNFPVLIKLDSGTDIDYTKTMNAGEDIRFTDSNGTDLLKYEIEKWDETGTSYVWVKVPSIDINASADYIYMYYGKADAVDAQDAVNVWDSNFKGVWHLKETDIDGGAGDIKDSLGVNNATSSGMDASDQVAGQIDGSFAFDGTDDCVDIANNIGVANSYTAEAWVNASTLTGGNTDQQLYGYTIIASSISAQGYPLWIAAKGTELNISSYDTAVLPNHTTNGANLTVGNWFHIVATAISGGTTQVFVNGVSILSYTNPGTSVWNNKFTIGDLRLNRIIGFSGTIDEVRISDSARTAGWIAASYKSESDAFITFGDEEVAETWLSGWSYRKKITFNNAAQDENLVGFPVLIKLDSGVEIDYTKTLNAGEDIRFTDSNGTDLLKYEIETWNESGSSYVWVKVPQIDASSATDFIYIYYGNLDATDAQDAVNVWDSNFKGVWHLKETDIDGGAGDIKDSTGVNNATSSGMDAADQVAGQIDGSFDFDGSNDSVNAGNGASLSMTTAITMEGWIKGDIGGNFIIAKIGDTTHRVYGIGGAASYPVMWLSPDGTQTNRWFRTSSVAPSTDAWHYIVGTFGGGTHIYIDGILRDGAVTGVEGASIGTTTANTTIGSSTGVQYFDGILDEVRISNSARTADWIAASYLSEADTFNTFGDEESSSDLPNTPSNASPTDGAASKSLTPTLTGSAFSDPNEESTHGASQWQVSTVSGNYGTPVYDSGTTSTALTTITIPSGLLNVSTTYFWHVRYQDSEANWSEYSTETSFITSQTPATPSNSAPTNGELNQKITPTLTSAAFSDADEEAAHSASQWLVRSLADPTYATPVYDSGTDTTNKTSLVVPAGELAKNTTYFWKVRHRDDAEIWSAYSTESAFTVGVTPVSVIAVGATEYTAGETARLTVQVKDADGAPLNNATTTISIYNPAGDKIVTAATASYLATSNGLYVYSYVVPATLGVYIYEVTAQSADGYSYSSHAFHNAQFASDITSIKSTAEDEETAQIAERAAQSAERTAQGTERGLQVAERVLTVAERTAQDAERTAQAASRTIVSDIQTRLVSMSSSMATLISEIGSGNISAIKTKTDTINWANITSILTNTGDIAAIKLKTDDIAWANITAIKTKTDTINWDNVTGIKLKTDTIVWGDITNVSNSVTTLINEIGTSNISAIKTKTDTINWANVTTILTNTGDIAAVKTKTDTIDWANVTGIKTNTDTIAWADVTGIKLKTDTIDWADVEDVQTRVLDIQTSADILLGALIVTQGTVVDAAASASSFITSLTNATNNFYNNAVLTFTSGTLDGQTRRISDYDGSTKTITLSPALTSAPADSDGFTIVKQNVYVEEQLGEHEAAQAISRAAITDIQTRVTDIQSIVSSTYALLDTVDGKIDTLDTNIDTTLTNLQTVDNNVDSVLGKWGDKTAAQIITDIASAQTAINNLSTSRQLNYTVRLSDVGEVQTTKTYRATLSVLNYESQPTDADALPTIAIYDAVRNTTNTGSMTKLSNGVYEYTYVVPDDATGGLWETIVTTDVGGAAPIIVQDYWEVEGAPAQVIINSVSDAVIPSITASVTISNEGEADYEYQYKYCVVSSEDNQCGGGDDVAYASAAKLITTGADWTTDLNLTVPTAGTYWFKTLVYWGTEVSGASRQFTATAATETATTTPAVTPSSSGSSISASPTMDAIYNKLVALQNELGTSGKTQAAYQDIAAIKSQMEAMSTQLMQPIYKEMTASAAQLNKVLAIIGDRIDPGSAGFKDLLEITEANLASSKDIKNKLADLRAVSAVTKKLVEQKVAEPVVETWMTFDSVVFNFLITNPAEEARTVNFKAFLPAEVKPEHIIKLDGLNIDYDVNATTYYVYKEVNLGPKESVTRKVEITDIWIYTDEEIASLKKQAEELIKPLRGTQYDAQGTILKNDIEATLDAILAKQKDGQRSPQDHIVAYRENSKRMETVVSNLNKMKDLLTQTGASQGIVGKVGGIQTFATWGIIAAIVFGLGLLAAVIFAMWRHQTRVMAEAFGQMARRDGDRYGG